ncbi:hypothetical protein M0R01_00305 [bacterium]|nr:hypothetical protein [bacterium]
MNQEYSKDFFWDTYKKLPEDLKEALFSDKNNEIINHICIQSGLNEEQVASVAKFTGRVLMGLLPLDELPVVIELELNISQDLANQINRQIYISIFKHLRVSLNKINDKNFSYKDQFTSENDGKEEDLKRREGAAPKVFSKPFPETSTDGLVKISSEKNTSSIPPNSPSIEKPIKVSENIAPQMSQTKEPPFSYNELPTIKEPLNKTETGNSEEKKIEKIELPTPNSAPKPPINTPSRSAFEQELEKESFPNIPVSFSSGTIPSVALGNDGSSKANENFEPKPAEKSSSTLDPKPTDKPVDTTSQIIVPDIPQAPQKEEIVKDSQANNKDDPYKESLI